MIVAGHAATGNAPIAGRKVVRHGDRVDNRSAGKGVSAGVADMSRRTSSTSRRAFSLIELMVVIGIIAILIAFLLPSLQMARQQALRVQCMSNMRQIGHGLMMYANTYRHLPLRLGTTNFEGTGDSWGYDEELIALKTAVKQTFICPSHVDAGMLTETPHQPSYGMNWYFDNQPYTKGKSSDILVAESFGPSGSGSHRADVFDNPPGQLDRYRHGAGGSSLTTSGQRRRSNWLFFDGHVEWLTYDDASGPETTGPDGQPSRQNWGVDHGDHGQFAF